MKISETTKHLPRPVEGAGVGEVLASEWEGMRHREIGQAQAWYYPLDRLLVLWECYLFDQWRQDDPVGDPALAGVWRGFEGELLARFRRPQRVATPAWEDLYERPAWQAFLTRQGYEPATPGVFVKGLGERNGRDRATASHE